MENEQPLSEEFVGAVESGEFDPSDPENNDTTDYVN